MSELFPQKVHIVVPFTPPSGNHYKLPRAIISKFTGKPMVMFYLSKEAEEFKRTVAILNRGQAIEAKEYELFIKVYLGKKERLDGDNSAKVVADALGACGAIRNDAHVKRWVIEMDRDWDRPRTEITIQPFGGYRGIE